MSRGREPIVQERRLSARPDEVFAAWSDPRRLAEWMCPAEDIGPASVSLEFRVGGRFHIVMHGAQGDYEHEGEYLEIDPPRRLVFTWISAFLPAAIARTRVTVTLEPDGTDATRIRLVHDELPEGDAYDGHVAGWGRILELVAASFQRVES